MDPTTLQEYSLAPVSRLPAELLLEVFDLVIEDCDLIMEWYQEITHVCRYWRQLAISTARLWTNLPLDSDCDNPYWTHTALERSKPAPLNISLYDTRWETNVAVFKHVARINILTIKNNLEELNKISFILTVVGDEPKELTALEICNNSEREGGPYKLPDSLSAATKLEHLDLRYTHIDWKSPLLLAQNLTWLTLHNAPSESGPSWEDLLAALARMPRLSMLDLKETFPLTPPESNTPSVHLSQLKNLIIACNEPSKVRSFLSRVTFPPLCLLGVGCGKVEHGQDGYANIIQYVIQKVPTSFTNDFLNLTVQGTPGSIQFACQSYHDNSTARPKQRIKFTLACMSGRVPTAIFRDVLTLLRLNTTLRSLYLHEPSARINPQDLVHLFGSIPGLATITIERGFGYYIAEALDISLNHLATPTPSFPCLETIRLIQIDFTQKRDAEQLEDSLIQRFENGVEITALKFLVCPGLDSVAIKRFEDIVVDVVWAPSYE